MSSWKTPTDESIEEVLSSVRKPGDRRYFFGRLKNPLWLQPLSERDYFNDPPNSVTLPEGSVHFPFWPELEYLKNVCGESSDDVIGILLSLPAVDNPRVYDGILEIALNLPGSQSGRLKPKILEYAAIENQFLAHRYQELISHWVAEQEITAALELAEVLVEFAPDPEYSRKQMLYEEDPRNFTALLKPYPRMEQWEYITLMQKGIRALAESEPFKTSCLLMKATVNMIYMEMYRADLAKRGEQDYSHIRYPKLRGREGSYTQPRESLVYTLTFACEKVYEKSDESTIAELDNALRNQRWKLFRRLRQHLYSLHPNDQTRPWIREAILQHTDYSQWQHDYEFQQMIRRSCESIGASLLSKEERERIFDSIRSGPSKDLFREWVGDNFTEDLYEQRRRTFHRMQFTPFASVLFGDYLSYFEKSTAESDESITDDEFATFGEIKGGPVVQKSPRPIEDLAELPDEELLDYINEWQDSFRDPKDWLIEISFEGLANAFQSIFRDRIVADDNSHRFWMENRERISRPIYVKTMVEEMREQISQNRITRLGEWLDFCEWVLSHPDIEELGHEYDEQNRESPNWRNSRTAVIQLIEACFDVEVGVPITFQDQFGKLLNILCTGFDYRLDSNSPIFPNQRDMIMEAINNTRSRALEVLIKFGLWTKRKDPSATVPFVTNILESRFSAEAEYRLTPPERAILGMYFGSVVGLDETWAAEYSREFFPQDKMPEWAQAFGSCLKVFGPRRPFFDFLEADYEFALQNMDEFADSGEFGIDSIDALGQHLFMYYMWGMYPLTGEDSLLERFYLKTDQDRSHWGNLFDHVGRSLRNSGDHINEELLTRAVAFFNWRYDQREPRELRHFSFWMQAECLDTEWRLKSYSRIIDLIGEPTALVSVESDALLTMLPEFTPGVLECLLKLTSLLGDSTFYIDTETARKILQVGLASGDESTRRNAEAARENLLRAGRIDFLDLG